MTSRRNENQKKKKRMLWCASHCNLNEMNINSMISHFIGTILGQPDAVHRIQTQAEWRYRRRGREREGTKEQFKGHRTMIWFRFFDVPMLCGLRIASSGSSEFLFLSPFRTSFARWWCIRFAAYAFNWVKHNLAASNCIIKLAQMH